MARDMIFVSHANPEDNEFTRWLSLQVANAGYPVWCDLTKLLGGETFWDDIQDAVKERTIKFLFVLSRSSNVKEGALQELDCAKGTAKKLKPAVRDFIIPLKIDELPHDDVHILVRRLNHISFQPSWAKGLAQLLEKLETDGVPKKPNFKPEAVGRWWRRQFDVNRGVTEEPEEYLSNWFPTTGLPERMFRHYVARDQIGKSKSTPLGSRTPPSKRVTSR